MKRQTIGWTLTARLVCGAAPAGELARWSSDEGKGTSTGDLSGHGWTLEMREGASGNNPTSKPLWGSEGDTPSGAGRALKLDGTDDFATAETGTVGHSQWTFSPETTATDFSFSAWVKPGDKQEHGIVLGHSDAAGYLGNAGWAWVRSAGKEALPRFDYAATLLDKSQPPREHHVRYDLASGACDMNIWPRFVGERFSVCRLDGFLASDRTRPGGPLFCVAVPSDEQQRQRLVCLVSRDGGKTWHDYAVSGLTFHSPCSIGGCRDVTADGHTIGSFTDQGPGDRVHFFTLPAR